MDSSEMASCLYCVPYHSSVLSVCPSNDFDTTATLKQKENRFTLAQRTCQKWLDICRRDITATSFGQRFINILSASNRRAKWDDNVQGFNYATLTLTSLKHSHASSQQPDGKVKTAISVMEGTGTQTVRVSQRRHAVSSLRSAKERTSYKNELCSNQVASHKKGLAVIATLEGF